MTSYKCVNKSFSWFLIKKIVDEAYFVRPVESKWGRATYIWYGSEITTGVPVENKGGPENFPTVSWGA